MNNTSKFNTGILFGIISAALSMLVIVLRYRFFGNTPQELGFASAAGYGIMVAIFFLAAQARKRQLGGYADVKELFGTLFVIILITEFCFSAFNYIYLQYIDPGYLERFSKSALEWMQKTRVPQDKLQEFEKALAEQQHTSFGTLALGFAQAVIVDSIVGIIIAFFLKKKRPVSA